MDYCNCVLAKGQTKSDNHPPLTDFGRAGLGVEQHATAVRKGAATAEQVSSQWLARFNGLKSKITTHGLGDVIAVLAALDALLCNVLDLCSPASVLVPCTPDTIYRTNRF